MKQLPALVARVPTGVRFKLLTAFLLVIALLSVIGAAGLQTLDEANKRAEALTVLQRKAAAYRQLQHDTTWQLYSLTETLLAKDKPRFESALRQLDQFRYDLDRVQFVSDGEKRLFRRIEATYEKLVAAITEVMELARDGKRDASIALKIDTAAPLAERLERLTNEMINRAEAGMIGRVREGQEAYHLSRYLIIGSVLVSIAIAMLLGYAISGSITDPVRSMDRVLGITASGNFSQRIEIPNRDEMGTLAANLNRMNGELARLYHELETKNRFIRQTFGRYLSDDVVKKILEAPDGLRRGGERRDVTVIVTDLRGFANLTERLEPEDVVTMLNTFFEVMIEEVQKYEGTINNIIGDSLVISFGATREMDNRIKQAVACSIAMQNAMVRANRENRARSLPALEMGIGIDDSPVIIGNIGTQNRLQHSIVGRAVNMASRIESYSVGGQILVSEVVRRSLGDALLVDRSMEIVAKGSELPIRIYGVAGMSGAYNIALTAGREELSSLGREILIEFSVLDKKIVQPENFNAVIRKLSRREAEIVADAELELFSNMKFNLRDLYDELAAKDCYAKVVDRVDGSQKRYVIRFTSAAPEVLAYFQAHMELASSDPSKA